MTTTPFHTNAGVTEGLAVLLRKALHGQIVNLTWRSHVMRDARGRGGEESATGADLIVHVSFKSPELSYSKGLLVQAKRVEKSQEMTQDAYDEIVDQCNKMLDITSAAWVFDYAHGGIRCAPASVIVGSNNKALHEQCVWRPYRFFLELFRCPIGDPRITSAKVEDLPVQADHSRNGDRGESTGVTRNVGESQARPKGDSKALRRNQAD
jgi:hypothetical protein